MRPFKSVFETMISSCGKNSSLFVGAAAGFTLGYSTSMFAGIENAARPLGDDLSGGGRKKADAGWKLVNGGLCQADFCAVPIKQAIDQNLHARAARHLAYAIAHRSEHLPVNTRIESVQSNARTTTD
jgi:hypothetical protein